MAGRLTFLAGIAVMVALVAVPSAGGRTTALLDLKVAKQKDGPYRSFLRAKAKPNDPAILWFRAKNVDDERLEGVLFGDDDTADLDGYKVSWFKHGDNVSSEVEGPGYDFNVDPGQAKYFMARAKPPNGNTGLCLKGQLTHEAVPYDVAYAGINDPCEA
jgi:hypothetical protein